MIYLSQLYSRSKPIKKRERTVNPTTCFIQIIKRLIKKHDFKFSHNWYISHNHNFFWEIWGRNKEKSCPRSYEFVKTMIPNQKKKQVPKSHRKHNYWIHQSTQHCQCHTRKLNQTKFQNKNQRNPNYPEDHTHYKHHNNLQNSLQ